MNYLIIFKPPYHVPFPTNWIQIEDQLVHTGHHIFDMKDIESINRIVPLDEDQLDALQKR